MTVALPGVGVGVPVGAGVDGGPGVRVCGESTVTSVFFFFDPYIIRIESLRSAIFYKIAESETAFCWHAKATQCDGELCPSSRVTW